MADYQIVAGDRGSVINVNTTYAPVSVALPAPANGFNITIKDASGQAFNRNITVQRSSDSVQIDGEANDDIITQNYGSISYISDGTNWFRVSSSLSSSRFGRGLISGGFTGSASNVIEYIDITSVGNSTNFGNLTVARFSGGSGSSQTRGLHGGGYTGAVSSVIDYVTIATLGNATSFGSLLFARADTCALSNAIRTVWVGGSGAPGQMVNGYSQTMDYVTIATLGNAAQFGLLAQARYNSTACASPTRGLVAGGAADVTSPGLLSEILYITIATTGNGTTFGNLTGVNRDFGGASSATRALFGGGNDTVILNRIDHVTIATTGNAGNFGNLTTGRYQMAATSNSLRAVWAGGNTGSISSVMDYVTIANLSNATNFGTLTTARRYTHGSSDSHGGL